MVLVSVAVLILPGLLVARAAGLRGWIAAGAAAPVSYGIAATAGPASSALGVPWRPVTMTVATALLAGLCWSIRAASLRRGTAAADHLGARRDPYGDRVVAAGVLAGAGLGALVIMQGIGGLDAVHQGWDAGFHANAVRFITETGNAAPGALSAINNYEDDTFFYPNAQHVLTAIVGQLTDAPVPSLLNVQMLLLPGIAGLGLAVLVRTFHGRVALAASVPLVLASFSGFPYGLLSRGPLLPYAIGLALVPAFMALLDRTLSARGVPAVLVTGVAAAGLLAVHPSIALTAAIVTIPLLLRRWRGRREGVRRADLVRLSAVASVTAVAALPILLGIVAVAEGPAAVDWPADHSMWQGVTDLFVLGRGSSGPQLWLVALMAIGAISVRGIRQLWWWLAGGAMFAVMFVIVSSSDAPLTEALTQPWWNDRWRFLALVTLSLALLAAHGAVVVGDALAGVAQRLAGERAVTPRAAMGMAMALVIATFGVTSSSFYASANEAQVNRNYEGGPTVTAGEEVAMRVLAQLAGSDGRVMNDPGDGSAWMYALEGVRPIFGHVIDPTTFGSIGDDQQLLLSSFHCLDSSPAVRQLVEKYDIGYVFLGQGYLREWFSRIPGLRGLRMVDSLDLVYDRDGTAIYRVRLGDLAPDSADELSCEDS